LTAVDERVEASVGAQQSPASSFTASAMSPVHDDHDYVCCRGSKVFTVSKDLNSRSNVPPDVVVGGGGGGEPKTTTTTREVSKQ